LPQFTVELRQSELLAADYLVTCKRWGESTRFSILRAGEPREFSAVLAPLPHHMPRASGFDCVPTYAILGGLVFVPLCCPMFDYKEHKHVSQQAPEQSSNVGSSTVGSARVSSTVVRACAQLYNLPLPLTLTPTPTQLYNLVSHSMTSTFCADAALSTGPIVLINIEPQPQP
tara:strand:- start:293 stop:808 length:516 start_codon:yes stop_codon:yes gene_type:complete